jgi:serine/threonine protein kinase
LQSEKLVSKFAAFKCNLYRYVVEPNDRRRVGREIRVLKRLAQEYIIRLFDVVDSPTRVYMVMEYADGGAVRVINPLHPQLETAWFQPLSL